MRYSESDIPREAVWKADYLLKYNYITKQTRDEIMKECSRRQEKMDKQEREIFFA